MRVGVVAIGEGQSCMRQDIEIYVAGMGELEVNPGMDKEPATPDEARKILGLKIS